DSWSLLDKFNLGGQKMVFSSEEKSKKESSKIPSLSEVPTAIKKGASLLANLDLTKLKIDHLIGVKQLVVSSPLTTKLEKINLDANLDTNIPLGEAATLEDVILRLTPSPKNFGVSLLGTVHTKVNGEVLKFTGGVELVLTDQKLNFKAIMDGKWKDPMGAKGLTVSDLGIQLGASFTTAPVLLPNIALSGKLNIGSFSGHGTVAFDTRNPTKSMLSAGFNKLSIWDLASVAIDKEIKRKIPKPMSNALDKAGFKDVELEIVPTSMQVLEKYYDAGFRAEGAIQIAGFRANGLLDINYKNGIYCFAYTDPVDLGVFKLQGANGQKRPGFVIDLQKNRTPKFAVNGAVSLLGLTGMTDIHFVDDGFRFMVGGKVFNLFQGTITASGGNIKEGGQMYAKVEMEQSFFGFVKKDVSAAVKTSTKAGVDKLRGAYSKLKSAEQKVAAWDKEINAKRAEIRKKQSGARAKFDAANKTLSQHQSKVNQLNGQINKLKKEKNALAKFHPKKAWYETQIKAIQASLLVANGALEASKVFPPSVDL
ncbi:MAG: hypothetical protein AAGK97_11300, partial [Bacteroidota bacterium]